MPEHYFIFDFEATLRFSFSANITDYCLQRSSPRMYLSQSSKHSLLNATVLRNNLDMFNCTRTSRMHFLHKLYSCPSLIYRIVSSVFLQNITNFSHHSSTSDSSISQWFVHITSNPHINVHIPIAIHPAKHIAVNITDMILNTPLHEYQLNVKNKLSVSIWINNINETITHFTICTIITSPCNKHRQAPRLVSSS